jgi:hypothetical protein
MARKKLSYQLGIRNRRRSMGIDLSATIPQTIIPGQMQDQSMKLGVGLCGSNGHQIDLQLRNHLRAGAVAFARMADPKVEIELSSQGAVRRDSLQALLDGRGLGK